MCPNRGADDPSRDKKSGVGDEIIGRKMHFGFLF